MPTTSRDFAVMEARRLQAARLFGRGESAADLINVCVAGAESLKATMSTLQSGTQAAIARRTVYAWFLVLTHGGLVSDAFDSSVR